MKFLRLFYILSCVWFAVFSIALLGASGYAVLNFENSENVFFIVFAVLMALLGAVEIVALYKPKASSSILYLILFLIALVDEIVVFIGFFTLGRYEKTQLLFFEIWLSVLMVLTTVFIIKSWKTR